LALGIVWLSLPEIGDFYPSLRGVFEEAITFRESLGRLRKVIAASLGDSLLAMTVWEMMSRDESPPKAA